MNRLSLVPLLMLIAACSREPAHTSAAAKATTSARTGEDNASTGTASTASDGTEASKSGAGTSTGSTATDTGPETKATAVDAAAVRIPDGCTGQGDVAGDDLILFNGEMIQLNASNQTIAINAGWSINGAWDNGRIGVETHRNQPAITFTNETYYHGFNISPPEVNGKLRPFTMQGVDVYYDTNKTADAHFGFRIFKPGEMDPNRSWLKLIPHDAGKDLDLVQGVAEAGQCKLVHFYTSQEFLDQDKTAERYIWEMMPDWNPADKLYIYKIVIKGLRWK